LRAILTLMQRKTRIERIHTFSAQKTNSTLFQSPANTHFMNDRNNFGAVDDFSLEGAALEGDHRRRHSVPILAQVRMCTSVIGPRLYGGKECKCGARHLMKRG
jgi:hypothetical protein